MKILDGRHSSTPFATLGQPYVPNVLRHIAALTSSRTRCLGRDEPQAIELLVKDGFEKVLEL